MDAPPPRFRTWLSELRSRGVLRVATYYGTASFVLLEVADIVLPALFLPGWALTVVVGLVVAGFPLAMAISWAYDLTPAGFERTDPAPAAAIEWKRLIPGVGLASVAVVAMGVATSLLIRSQTLATDPGRVVVTVFANETGDAALDGVGQMAADWVARGLTRTGLVDVIPTATAFMSSYFHAGPGGSASDPAIAVARETGAATIVSGSVYRAGDRLEVQARITDVASGRLLAALDPVEGPVEDPREAVDRLQDRVAGAIATLMNPRLEAVSTPGGALPTYEAYRSFAEGFEAFTARDFPRALQSFHAAHQRDTTFAHPLLWSGFAYWFLGATAQADSLAKLVELHRDRLLPIEVLQLEHLRGIVTDDANRFTAAARQGFERTGDALWRYLYATALSVTNRPAETVVLFRDLDPRGSLMDGFWQYWSWPLGDLHRLGRHAEEIGMARTAAEQYPGEPRIRVHEPVALLALGRVQEAESAVDRLMPPPPGGVGLRGPQLRFLANEALAHGHREAAHRMHERAVTWFEADPARTAGRGAADYGSVLAGVGRYEDAIESLERAVEARPDDWLLVGALGAVMAEAGFADRARELAERLVPLEVQTVTGAPQPQLRAYIASLLGERDRAVALLRESFANGTYYGTWVHSERSLAPLRGFPPFEELVRPIG